MVRQITSLLAGALFVLKVLKWLGELPVLAGLLVTLKVLKRSINAVLVGPLGTLKLLKWSGELPQCQLAGPAQTLEVLKWSGELLYTCARTDSTALLSSHRGCSKDKIPPTLVLRPSTILSLLLFRQF